MWLATELLMDPNFQEGLMLSREGDLEDTDHTYAELNTGRWWHDTEMEEVPEV